MIIAARVGVMVVAAVVRAQADNSAGAGLMKAAPLAAEDGRALIRIASIKQLYGLQAGSNQHVVLAPGRYPINLHTAADFGGVWPSSSCGTACAGCVALFNFSGSNNIWDMSGVTIAFDTAVLGAYHCNHGPHGTGNLLGGSNNVWRGLTWQDIAPLDKTLDYAGFFPGSGATFVLQGAGHVMDGVRISLRGSGLYGFGALYGKGSGSLPGVTMSKRSLLAIVGARDILINDCHFDNSAFGHLIHIHDRGPNTTLPHTDNITIVNSSVTGEVRNTDDLIANGVGGVDRHGVPFRVKYEGSLFAGGPPGAVSGAAGQAAFEPVFRQKLDRTAHCKGPIAPRKAFALTECGLRFYSNVSFVTFVNVSNYQTRCGACLGAGVGGALVDQLAVRSIAPHGYAACAVGEQGGLHSELGSSFQPPSNSRFTRCSGDATYVPLLDLVGDGAHVKIVNVTGDFELLPPEPGHAYGRTSDALADIAGHGHAIRLWGSGGVSAAAAGLLTYVGYTKDASNITLCNLLPTPVLLGNRSSGARVWSVGPVTDEGQSNKVVRVLDVPGAHLPSECAPFEPIY
jgi:hypothetical protein